MVSPNPFAKAPEHRDDPNVPIFASDHERHALLTWWARAVTARPWTVLLVSFALAAGAISITAARLEFRSDRSDLVDPSLDWQQRYSAFKKAFPRWDDAVVVIDTRSAESPVIEAFVSELAAALRNDDRFNSVTDGIDPARAPATLLLTAPTEEVRAQAAQLARATPILAAPTLADLLTFSTLAPTRISAEDRNQLTGLLQRTALVAQGDPSPLLFPPLPVERLTVGDGKLIVLLIALADKGAGATAPKTSGIAALRAHIESLRTKPDFANVQAGVTGVPVLESDEAALSMRDATRASILALILIASLMMIVYRGAVVPLLAIASLLIGVAWSFGYLTLIVGHLQLLSVVFAIMLLGLGVDTAVHLIARLELVHPDHAHMPEAVAQAFRGVGPGVLTGAFTTAAAFGATAFTKFDGVAEMGIIAAGGVLLCTLSVMSCFPAALEILPFPERRLRTRPGGERKPFMGGSLNFVDHHPGPFILLWAALLVGFGVAASYIRYDSDLMKLLPDTTESVRWEEALRQADAQSVWHAVVRTESMEEASQLTRTLEKLGPVGGVGGVAMLVPSPAEVRAKVDIVRTIIPKPPTTPVDTTQSSIRDIRPVARRTAELFKETDPELRAAAVRIAQVSDENLARVNAVYARERSDLAQRIRTLRAGALPTPDELPPALHDQFVGVDGSLLLRVFPAANTENPEESPLAPAQLSEFASAVLRVAPQATGPAIQIYESTSLIGRAYLIAAALAAGAILVILFLDFRSLVDVVCALTPVLCGLTLLLGTLAIFGVRLNLANTIVMPLIIGLGVDSGVHALHRWRAQPLDSPAGLAGGSGRAITMTTATTAIGFACMMAGSHRGMASLGLVMTLGLVFVWLATVFLLPAVLRVRTTARVVGQAGARAYRG